MAFDDWIETGRTPSRGGQGEVREVRHHDGRHAVLKRLHSEVGISTANRFRFLNEVASLRAMEGRGVPGVFEANEDQWQEKDIALYMIMERIEGKTIDQLYRNRVPSLDDAILCTLNLLKTLNSVHDLSIIHRDIKPSNVILQNNDWRSPILVDFGLSGRENREDNHKTPIGKELGNRPLRLPELAPFGEHYDPRSDLSMITGIFLYMLCGRSPHTLLDEQGRYPHEAELENIRTIIISDKRWKRLSQILYIGFQYNIKYRYQNADEFIQAIMKLNEEPINMPDDLERQIEELR